MGNRAAFPNRGDLPDPRQSRRYEPIVLAVATAVFFGCIVSPPSLMDDVDAVQAQIARNLSFRPVDRERLPTLIESGGKFVFFDQ